MTIVNVFEQPYEVWETRDPTPKERLEYLTNCGTMLYSVNTKLVDTIADHFSAAEYILKYEADNGLEFRIDAYLHDSKEFNDLLNAMPKDLPRSVYDYKHGYADCQLDAVTSDIEKYGVNLSEKQYLFHGGFLACKPGDHFVLNRPLSTSFCPQVALRNAEWKGKAYEAGEVHLLVLNVVTSKTKAFVFALDGELGNEKEVLFSSGLELIVRSKTLVRNNYSVSKIGERCRRMEKSVDAFVIAADIT